MADVAVGALRSAIMPTDTIASRGRPRQPIPTGDDGDAIREAIIARVEELGYDRRAVADWDNLAEQCGGTPGRDAIRRYLHRKTSLSSRYVSTLCGVLGLELRVREDAT